MADAGAVEADIGAALKVTGLHTLGWFETEAGLSALLVGNIGGSHWQAFSTSPFYTDGLADPMNRWTRSVLEPLAGTFACSICYPFGDVVWPFQRWASAAMGMHPSPLGLFIHPQYGLWVAFRGALVFRDAISLPKSPVGDHPCDTCQDKPCLSACPVFAFSDDGFDVAACRDYLSQTPTPDCRGQGCRARLACPVGAEFAYEPEQQAFHMDAFQPVNR